MLEVSDLHSGFGRIPIVRGLSMHLKAGELLGVLGHNGAGKTTMLRTIAGFLPTTSGQIQIEGKAVGKMPPHARARLGLGYVPQGRQIFPTLTVMENLEIAARRGKRPIDEVLEIFPRIKRLLDRPGGALSGGEQQILALARCLCTRPKILLLDEPTEGIQPSIIEEIIETLQTICKSEGLTVLLVEQNLECLSALAERILVLHRGTIIKELTQDEAHDRDILSQLLM